MDRGPKVPDEVVGTTKVKEPEFTSSDTVLGVDLEWIVGFGLRTGVSGGRRQPPLGRRRVPDTTPPRKPYVEAHGTW